MRSLIPICPHCGKRAYVLSPCWRNHGNSGTHTCTHCGGKVNVTFRGRTYLAWWSVLATTSVLIGLAFGVRAFSYAFTFSFLLPLVLSMQLENPA